MYCTFMYASMCMHLCLYVYIYIYVCIYMCVYIFFLVCIPMYISLLVRPTNCRPTNCKKSGFAPCPLSIYLEPSSCWLSSLSWFLPVYQIFIFYFFNFVFHFIFIFQSFQF